MLEPFTYPFMREALLAGTVIATVCAVLSCYLVLRGWSLMGDAIAHAVLPGIVLAYLAGLPLVLGAFATGMLCAAGTGLLKRHSRLREDTVMGIAFTGLFALGLILISRVRTHLHLDHILFGNILGLPRAELLTSLILAVVVLGVVLAKRKDFLLVSFDASQARVLGLRVSMLNYALLALLALTIVASLQAVGVILVIAMLITPGAVAHLLTDSFDRMLVIAVATAVGSTALGIYVSYWIGGSTGACIVLTQALVFAGAMVFAPRHGVLAQRKRQG